MNPGSEEIERSWKKFERGALKAGLRNGLSDGRDSIYQHSFDEGYKQGFENGFLLAKYKGQLLAKSKSGSSNIEIDEILEAPKKALCQMCPDQNFTTKALDEIKNNQKLIMDEGLKKLQQKYDNHSY